MGNREWKMGRGKSEGEREKRKMNRDLSTNYANFHELFKSFLNMKKRLLRS